MAQTTITAEDLLKEFYLPGVRNQLNDEIYFLGEVEKTSEDVEGLEAVLSLRVRRNSGVGARADGGALPTAGRQSYVKQRVPLKYNYGRIQVSGPLVAAGKTDAGSFARPLAQENEGVVADLKRDVNRQLFGTSDGAIAACGLTTSSTIIVMAVGNFSETQQFQIQEGMKIDIGTVASPTASYTGLTVASVGTTTITVETTSVTTATTSIIFRSGSGGATSAQKELTGLQTQISSGDALFGVSGTTYGAWNSYVNGNSGTDRAVTENLFITAQQSVRRDSGGEIDLWVTTAGVQRQVANLLQSIKRFPNTLELKGGYTGIDMAAAGAGRSGGKSVALVWDEDCPANTAFGISTDKFKYHRSSDWDFMDMDGSVLSRVAGYDAYEAVLYQYSELATDNRGAHARLNDLSES